MTKFPAAIQKLIHEFNKLPGIGPKTSQRFVFYLLKQSPRRLQELLTALNDLPKNIKICEQCFAFAAQSPCDICRRPDRDQRLICVVAESYDVATLEGTGAVNGVYHVLNGLVDPLNQITPDILNINSLIVRITKARPPISEVIMALNQTAEGEMTELYLKKILRPLNVKITKLARGLPTGADLEYADELTLTNALKSRREF